MKKISLFLLLLIFLVTKLFESIGWKKSSLTLFEPYQLLNTNYEQFASNGIDPYFLIYLIVNLLNYIFKFYAQFSFANIFFLVLAILIYLRKIDLSSSLTDKRKSIYLKLIALNIILTVFIFSIFSPIFADWNRNMVFNKFLSNILFIASIILLYVYNLVQIFLSLSLFIYLFDCFKNFLDKGIYSSKIMIDINLKVIVALSLVYTMLDFLGIFQIINGFFYLMQVDHDMNNMYEILKFTIYGKLIYFCILFFYLLYWTLKRELIEKRRIQIFFFCVIVLYFILDLNKNNIIDSGTPFLNLLYLFIFFVYFIVVIRNKPNTEKIYGE